ncbi:LysR family transcriptional regulator [Luteolibacter sp. AS25]|uniref:LysR family transcriptional regulator n=1 Tax=Luteolibacter sp. AS25 TaxID=3135776 RepID=UPI00398AF8F8
MEFHQLRYFVAAAEELSMSRAAEREHVSQPALSRQVKLLEEELGVPLFDRIKKRIHLTDAGKFFLLKARQLLCDSEISTQQVRERFGGKRRPLRLGSLSPFLDDLIAPAVREFQQRHTNSKVSIFDLPPRAQLDRLRLNELDLGILANLEEREREIFDVRTLSRHKFVAVLPASHRLAHRKSLKLAELKEENYVSLSNTFFPKRREFLMECCAKAGFIPKITAEMDSLPMMLAEIGTGGGVGIMPEHAGKLPHSGCALVSLTSPTIHSELLLVLAKAPQSMELQSLIALIEEGAARL